MNITVNGESRSVPDRCTAQQLLEMMDLADTRVAVEINLEIVPRSAYDRHLLQADDRVEVVRAIGGG